MSLFSAITKRKSNRNFINIPLDNKQLDEMIAVLKNFELLHLDSPLDYRIVSQTKGMFNVDAPHYLIISGQGKKHEEENAGFVGQKFVLWLHTKGIGSVWQGKSKDIEKSHNENDLIIIAFGKTKDPIERELSDFKRKKIEAITNTPEDECIKAVHLAPSGINLQPWYFEKKDNKIIVYKQILKVPLSLFYKTTAVDMGVALCHYALACEHFGKPFLFKSIDGKSDKKDFTLFGEISVKKPEKL